MSKSAQMYTFLFAVVVTTVGILLTAIYSTMIAPQLTPQEPASIHPTSSIYNITIIHTNTTLTRQEYFLLSAFFSTIEFSLSLLVSSVLLVVRYFGLKRLVKLMFIANFPVQMFALPAFTSVSVANLLKYGNASGISIFVNIFLLFMVFVMLFRIFGEIWAKPMSCQVDSKAENRSADIDIVNGISAILWVVGSATFFNMVAIITPFDKYMGVALLLLGIPLLINSARVASRAGAISVLDRYSVMELALLSMAMTFGFTLMQVM